MASRREFLQAGVAASVFPLMAAGKTQTAASPPFYKVIFDSRFPASRTFANRSEQLGSAVQPIEGDITALWYRDLYERWRTGPVAMAGLTLNGALFCLDVLARDHGMRVVFRQEHASAFDPEALADQVTHIAARALEATPPVVIVPHLTRPEGNPEPLVSWVIVPAGARFID